MTKEERNAKAREWYQARKEEIIAKKKAYSQSHKEQAKEYKKKWYQAHKEEIIPKKKAYKEAHKEEAKAYMKTYHKADLNSLGQTKHSIRVKSHAILKKMNLKIPGYEIHHCFGYNDPTKFIYISKSLHLKIHQFLRDNNIEADNDHWMQIRDMVLHCNEYFYAKI